MHLEGRVGNRAFLAGWGRGCMPGMTARPIFVAPGGGDVPVDDVRPVLVVAGTARRVVGRVLDMVVVWATVAVLGLVVSPGLDKDETLATALMITMMAGSVAVVLLLRVTALALSGCTLGQRLAGTRVVDAGTVVVRAGRALGRPPG